MGRGTDLEKEVRIESYGEEEEKQQGHYCRICGDYKANEKFSGKGHARHICKSCMSAMRSGKNPEDIFPGAVTREP